MTDERPLSEQLQKYVDGHLDTPMTRGFQRMADAATALEAEVAGLRELADYHQRMREANEAEEDFQRGEGGR